MQVLNRLPIVIPWVIHRRSTGVDKWCMHTGQFPHSITGDVWAQPHGGLLARWNKAGAEDMGLAVHHRDQKLRTTGPLVTIREWPCTVSHIS